MAAPTGARKLRILLTNDDGPPSGPGGHSPFIYPFARQLAAQLDADVRVVVPASQRSWVGKAYHIAEKTTGVYYYPAGEDGTEGESHELPRERRDGEMEWILLKGTPATCASIALHNLFAPDSFDLVISGPNFGRNTSTAFALSSGTLGAAMAASLSGAKAIALSWALMDGYKPPPKEFVDAASKASCDVVKRLTELGWGSGDEQVDVYSVNVPLLPEIVSAPEVRWTSMARTNYGRLFKSTPHPDSAASQNKGGPAAVAEPQDAAAAASSSSAAEAGDAQGSELLGVKDEHKSEKLHFVFAPDISALVSPKMEDLVEGTDKHAIHTGAISVTPIRSAFMEAAPPTGIPVEGLRWKI
ncbi:5'/3'-nucleotidase SurE [Rhodotorula paludigena]|uniref:5'/3'-nucleotidase SurE n=1 Tax=Rhodotorula paludigena TaxID=86838 RepID=UPI003178FE67